MHSRAEKRPREDSFSENNELYEDDFNDALKHKISAIEARSNLLPEAQPLFERAKDQLIKLVGLLRTAVYLKVTPIKFINPTTFDEHSRPFIFRYIEVITQLGELFLEFECFDEAEKYILEYINLKDHYQANLGDENSDSLANDYFNLGVIHQKRFERSNNQADLLASTTWLIKALAEYRKLLNASECYETATEIVNNFITKADANDYQIKFLNQEVKHLITKAIAEAVSELHLQQLSKSFKKVVKFLDPAHWQKPYKKINGFRSDEHDEEELKGIVKLQKEFTPEVFEKHKPVLGNAGLSKVRKKNAEQSAELPPGYSFWAPSNKVEDSVSSPSFQNILNADEQPVLLPADSLSFAIFDDEEIPSFGI